ncbi:hypothetical protein NDU88_003697 [Pleurodeles waltl]|uniref:Uncharacterized protein n=1 Tax=Pleurodeles waltl TaxID=8319 RepID=A0AAV7WTR5_PLEWA|nr:hypothetical protein NDU88_003697 [Pleurodeles waltl]
MTVASQRSPDPRSTPLPLRGRHARSSSPWGEPLTPRRSAWEAQARVHATRESQSRSPPRREQAQMGARTVASGTGSVRPRSGQSRPGPPGTRGFR